MAAIGPFARACALCALLVPASIAPHAMWAQQAPAPQLTAAPAIDAGGKLRLSGVFPTRPQQIKFDLMFEVSAGQWKLLGIAINTPEAPPLAAQAQEPKQEPKQEPRPPAKPTAAAEPAKRAPGNTPR